MKYNHLTDIDIKHLQSIASSDRFSTGESNLDLHSKDQSKHPAHSPEAVIWPLNASEISKILSYANNRLIPVTPWGAGSSLEGNPIPVKGGIVLDFTQMNRILDIREGDFQADVEPGVIYQDLNSKLRHQGLFFPPDPGAKATIGGMIANNASGTRTVRYGATKDNVLKLTLVLANGDIIETGTRASKTSSGYNLGQLFIGSEGTLGIVAEATVKLHGRPAEFSAVIATFPSVEAAGKTVFEIIKSGLEPASLELLGPECIDLINKYHGLGLGICPTLFMEFHGPSVTQLTDTLEMVREICEPEGCNDFRPGIGREERDNLLKARHEMAETIMRNHPGCSHIAIDIAVPITAYPKMIALADNERKKSGIPGYVFSHAGDGNLHLVFEGKTGDRNEWAVIDEINRRMVSYALSMGGTATGEHGVGIGKRRFMKAEHGKGLDLMKGIKELLDPNGILNPGKVLP